MNINTNGDLSFVDSEDDKFCSHEFWEGNKQYLEIQIIDLYIQIVDFPIITTYLNELIELKEI